MRPYVAAAHGGFRRIVAGPADLITRVGFFAIILLVMAALWRAAVISGHGVIAGYDTRALLWYVFGAQAAVAAVPPRTIEEIGDDIGSGSIAIAMLRPVSVFGLRFATDAGEAAARLCAVGVVGMAVTLLVAGAPPSWGALFLAAPAIALGAIANMAAQYAFGAVAFWMRDAKSAWFLFQKLVFLPGGMLIPLELLPAPVAAVSRALPFAAMAYVPGRSASGHPAPELLLWQAMWCVVLVALAAGIFSLGERRVEVLGG